MLINLVFVLLLSTNFHLSATQEETQTAEPEERLQQEFNPSTTIEDKFNSYADAIQEALNETDVDVVLDIVVATTFSERLQITKAYNHKYAKELDEELEGKLGNNDLGNLIAGMFVPTAVFLAKDLRSAITGLGTDEDTLSEIMCCLNAFQRKELRETYHNHLHTDLVKDIEEDTSSNYETLLLQLASVARNDDEKDVESFKLKVADAVMKLISETQKIPTFSSWPTSKSPLYEVVLGNFQPIVDVFSSNSFVVIEMASRKFEKITGNKLKETIRRSTSGDFQDLLLSILHFSENRLNFYARKIHAGLTQYWFQPSRKPLTRALVMLSKVELAQLQVIYREINGWRIIHELNGNSRDPYKSAGRLEYFGGGGGVATTPLFGSFHQKLSASIRSSALMGGYQFSVGGGDTPPTAVPIFHVMLKVVDWVRRPTSADEHAAITSLVHLSLELMLVAAVIL
ncbi:unnamed protein product [Orchesella dallaii]|uniref:Annexin n=1 Tax=Orchesella dallaii TaxID=48710 RepID=A0ABP1RKH6_9HEXA